MPKLSFTGATGYLGTEILRQLLRCDAVGAVVALVRAESAGHGADRVRQTALVAGWWPPSRGADKLEVWVGDLARPQLGLAGRQLERLRSSAADGANVDAMIHAGAVVNWNADYDTLRGPNVDATVDLLRIVAASRARPKFVYVSGGLKETDGEAMPALCERLATRIGYSQTKIMAARLPPDQNRVSSVKLGLIIGAAETGITNVDDFLWRAADDHWMHVAEVQARGRHRHPVALRRPRRARRRRHA